MEPPKDNNNTLDQYSPEMMPLNIQQAESIHQDLKDQYEEKGIFEKAMSQINQESKVSSLFDGLEDKRLDFKNEGFRVADAYTRLNSGEYITRYDDFQLGTDNEERHAIRQQTGEIDHDYGQKFLLKTAINVAGTVVGTVAGLAEAVTTGNKEAIYDNDFFKYLDDFTTKQDTFSATYKTQKERNMSFGESLSTASFWADDFLGGMSFLTGALISEGIFAAATGGTSMATTAARWGARFALAGRAGAGIAKNGLSQGIKAAVRTSKTMSQEALLRAPAVANKFGLAGDIAKTMRYTYTSAGYEAGMEARLFKTEQENNFYLNFQDANGRLPTSEERVEFNKTLEDTANVLFVTNLALVGASNLAIFGKALNMKTPAFFDGKKINQAIFGGGTRTIRDAAGKSVTTAVARTMTQRIGGVTTAVFRAPIIEGMWEEGGQATMSGAAEKYIESYYDLNKETVGAMEAFYEGLSHTYGTKEGWKEVGLGMLIGLVGGRASGFISGGAKGIVGDIVDAGSKTSAEADKVAKSRNENSAFDLVNKLYADTVTNNIQVNSQINSATQASSAAFERGDLAEAATSDSMAMAHSVLKANEDGYLEDHIQDFNETIDLKTNEQFATEYGVSVEQAEGIKSTLKADFKKQADAAEKHSTFAEYMFPDAARKYEVGGITVNGALLRRVVAFQGMMSDQTSENATIFKRELIKEMIKVDGQSSKIFTDALTQHNAASRVSKELVTENKNLNSKRESLEGQIRILEEKLQIENSKGSERVEENTSKRRDSNKANSIAKSLLDTKKQLAQTQEDIIENSAKINRESGRMSASSSVRQMSNRILETDTESSSLLDINPLETDVVEPINLNKTEETLAKYADRIDQLRKTDPQAAERLEKLVDQYQKSITIWRKNSETMADITDPEMGLDKIKSMFIRKGGTISDHSQRVIEQLIASNTAQQLIDGELSRTPFSEATSETDEETEAEGTNAEGQKTASVRKRKPPITAAQRLRAKLKSIMGNSSYVSNFGETPEEIVAARPTEDDLNRYDELKDKITKSRRTKIIKSQEELQGEELEFKELSVKLMGWRLVEGTNKGRYQVIDILNQIEALEKEPGQKNATQITAEQTVELTSKEQGKSTSAAANSDITNTMSYAVGRRMRGDMTEFSHIGKKGLEDAGYTVEEGQDENGDQTYTVSKEGVTNGITMKVLNGERLLIENKDSKILEQDMQLAFIDYKEVRSSWTYMFQKIGDFFEPMKSIFKITKDGSSISIMEDESLYKLKPGDKIRYQLDVANSFNREVIEPMIEQYLNETDPAEKKRLKTEIENNVSIYTISDQNSILGYLKANYKSKEETPKNLRTIRKNAADVLISEYTKGNILKRIGAKSELILLPFSTTVERVYPGSPNIRLDANQNIVLNPFKPEHSKLITDFGYSDGKENMLNGEGSLKGVDMIFIPKGRVTPFVVIQQGNKRIAFPVTLTATDQGASQAATDIINSEMTSGEKTTKLIELLMENGLDPEAMGVLSFNFQSSPQKINALLAALSNEPRTYTEKEILDKGLTKEEFLANSQIIIDLDKSPFIGAKLVTKLSVKMEKGATATNEDGTKIEPQTDDELIRQFQEELLEGEDLDLAVSNLDSDNFRLRYAMNKGFKKKVEKFVKQHKLISQIHTPESKKEQIENNVTIEDLESGNLSSAGVENSEELTEEIEDVLNNPSEENKSKLAEKAKMKPSKRAVKIDDAEATYIYNSQEDNATIFEKYSMIRIFGQMFKKVDNTLENSEIISQIYERYQDKTLPSHIKMEEGLSLEDFKMEAEKMGMTTPQSTYEIFFNAKPYDHIPYTVTPQGFDKAEFTQRMKDLITIEKNKASDLYKKILINFKPTPMGYELVLNKVSLEELEEFSDELGDMYAQIITASLTSKLIDLGVEIENPIFDELDSERLTALNNFGYLTEVKAYDTVNDGEIVTKSNRGYFIRIGENVYEHLGTSGKNHLYKIIGQINRSEMQLEAEMPVALTMLQDISLDKLEESVAKYKKQLEDEKDDKGLQCKQNS